jgi:hypothetical protein
MRHVYGDETVLGPFYMPKVLKHPPSPLFVEAMVLVVPRTGMDVLGNVLACATRELSVLLSVDRAYQREHESPMKKAPATV